MRITFLNQKGGVGKSTMSLLIGSVLARAGYDVVIDDRDQTQGTATHFAPTYGVRTTAEAPEAEYIITDTPGHLKPDELPTLAPLIAQSDRVILVTEKSPASLHGAGPMANVIKEHLRNGAKAYVLFNKVSRRSLIGQQEPKVLAADWGLEALTWEVPRDQAYENSQAAGLAAVTGEHRTILLNVALEIMR